MKKSKKTSRLKAAKTTKQARRTASRPVGAAAKPKRGSAAGPEQKTAYHHGDLRNTLLEAAETLLEEGGIEALSLRDAARRAGVSHSAPYRHFPAKIDLLYALAERGFRALDAGMRSAGEASPDAVEQLEEAGFAYVRLAVRHPWRTRLMFGGLAPLHEHAPLSLQEIARSSFDGLFRIIVGGQEQGVFVDQEPLQLSLAVWALVHGTAMLIAGGQFRGPESGPAGPGDDELRSMVRVIHRANMMGILRDGHRAKVSAALQLPAWLPGVGPVSGDSKRGCDTPDE